jgi:hypothetical protein
MGAAKACVRPARSSACSAASTPVAAADPPTDKNACEKYGQPALYPNAGYFELLLRR